MTRRRLSFVALALVALPSLLLAQRGGGRTRGPEKMDMSRIGKGGSPVKELEKENPVALLLDKKKDLKLADEEVNALKTINEQLKESVKPNLKAIDSVQKELKKNEDGPTTGEMFIARKLTEIETASVTSRYDAALKDALSKLTADHQQAASDLLAKEREERANSRRGGRPPATPRQR